MEAEIRSPWGCYYFLLLSHLQGKLFHDYLFPRVVIGLKEKKISCSGMEGGSEKRKWCEDICLRLSSEEIRGLQFFALFLFGFIGLRFIPN